MDCFVGTDLSVKIWELKYELKIWELNGIGNFNHELWKLITYNYTHLLLYQRLRVPKREIISIDASPDDFQSNRWEIYIVENWRIYWNSLNNFT